MASQEGIELSRLRVHRSPDHYVVREGTTSRSVSQLSTTNQIPQSSEAELAQQPSSIFPGSDIAVRDMDGLPSSSNDKSPLMQVEEKDTRTSSDKQKATVPWTLRRTSLLGLIAFLAALVTTLEVLHHLSDKNQGLITAKEDATYLWKYLPTAVFTLLAVYWKKLDYHTKALMPWKLMTEKPQPAGQSVLLDYVSADMLATLSGAFRHLHFPVITSTIGSLTIILVTVFSTGLFILQPTLVQEVTKVSVLSAFDGSQFNATAVDSFPVLAVSSIFSGNLSITYPPSTNIDHAVDTFSLQTTLNGSNASKSGVVEAFQADLDCKNGSVSSILATADPYNWELDIGVMGDGCNTTFTATPAEDFELSQLLSFGNTVLEQCPGTGQTKLFIFFGQMNISSLYNETHMKYTVIHSFDSTVLVCTPNHALQEALVTTDPAGHLRDVEVQRTLDKVITPPSELLTSFSTSIQAAAPTFLEGPFLREYNHGGTSYDGFFAILLATWSRNPAAYLDFETLMQDSRRFYTTTASQIANRFLRINSTRVASGSYRTIRLRVILGDTALRIIEAGLVTMIICCLVMIFFPCPSTSSTGTTLASMAVMMHRSVQIKSRFCGSGHMSLVRIEANLSGQSFSSNRNLNSIQIQGSGTTLPTSSSSAAGVATWWRPFAFSIYMKVALLTLPLTIVACLEVTYQVSSRDDGLDDAPSHRYGHYAWTWIPASTMTSVSLLYSSLVWSVVLLESYGILRTGSVAAQHTLCQGNLSKASIQLTLQGLGSRRYALLAASISALLAPLLTIIVSGLISVQSTRKTEDIVIPLADHILSPVGRVTDLEQWSQASLCAANLLYQGYGSYPEGTYQNLVFPNLAQSASRIILPVASRLPNASSIDVKAGVVMLNITCRVIDPAGFRYTVGINGINDPVETSPKYGWLGGDPGNSWLNFTHIDLADVGCGNPGIQCGRKIVSTGVELQANSSRFSTQVYGDDTHYTWTDPSAWPNGGSLRQAVAARNETAYVSPDVSLYYGTWNATFAQLHGIACYYDIRQGVANITYDLATNTVVSVYPYEEEFAVLSNYSQTLPWHGSYGKHLECLLPNSDLWQTAVNNTPEAFYDTPTGSDQLATQVSYLYNQFFTQFYNTALRSQNFTAGTLDYANATLIDDNYQRILQSGVSTRILEVLLLAMWICACIIYWLLDTKTLLPKNPCSIAAQASLLADSKFLDMIPEGAENATLEELIRMTPFKDHLFSMGWWDDGMGGRRFGIDVGTADFDKGEEDGEKVEEIGESGSGVEEIEEGMAGKADARVRVDIVGSRV